MALRLATSTILALALGGPAFAQPAAKVFVSVTAKGAAPSFLARLATPSGQVVVTTAPLAAANHVALPVTVEANEDLYLVEPGPGETKAYPGERGRIGGVVVVAMPVGADAHKFLGTHMAYAQKVDTDAKSERQAVRRDLKAPSLAARLGANAAKQVTALDVDREWIEARLGELTGAVPVTVNGRTFTITNRQSAVNRQNARAYLRAQYEALGYTVHEEPYGRSGGVNLVADRAGTDPTQVVILSAHLDTVATAGADDDGAGTIAALAVAKALESYNLKINLRVLAFDQEELGLLGSEAYVAAHDDNGDLDGLVGVINLEMLGYDADNDGAFHAIDCNENTSAELTALFTRVVARDPLRLHKTDACTNRSDHAAFWRVDRPAIVISQNFFGGDSNPCYHRSCDKVDRINFDYMTRLTTAVARGVGEWLIEP